MAGSAFTVAALILSSVTGASSAVAAPAADANSGTEYTVLAAEGASGADAVAAIQKAGGTVVEHNDAVGLYRVVAAGSGFIERADASTTLAGAAHRTSIGHAPKDRPKPAETETGPSSGHRPPHHPSPGLDPLDDRLWGLKMIHADQARTVTAGSKKVAVGILDTGVDASHPDISPNFNWKLSRNFAPDLVDIDGPCEVPSCLDPVGEDDGGHGTHVAGTIGAAANGLGVSGVAPNVSLVEIKGGQDSGFFFLEPVVNALTYAGDVGLDVVNMSFYVDPWLYNCAANPADTPAQQAEQRTIIRAVNRALTYAHRKGVTLVGSLGNNHEDLGAPRTDTTSPDFPEGTTYPRPIDNSSCIDLPVEGAYVIGVSALGPSGRKADYSNYGLEQISVAAPGGWFRDGLGTPTYRTFANEILSTYPRAVLLEEGLIDAAGNVLDPPGHEGEVLRDCNTKGICGYYRYLQGTSMASPHATGVAALIVSRYGSNDRRHPGTLTMEPSAVESVLTRTAAEHACPEPRLQSYVDVGRSAEFDALCVGTPEFNGFYGHGIVDAYAAVTARRH
jgi:subtilisin family serine protease